MYGRKTMLFLGTFLRILSVLYGFVIRIRLWFYTRGIFKQEKLQQRVVSIGNITLGGTGKTPAVIQIAGVLFKHRKHPVVISRGYGRRDESALVVVSDGKRVLVNAETGGDEPVLIGSKLTDVPVIADSNRYRAALYAREMFGSDIVILDDGFQHLRLWRDLDIVLIDAVEPFGSGKLFPAGILREPLSALKRADAILLTGTDRAKDLESLKRVIRQNTAAQIFTSFHVPSEIVNIMTEETKSLSSLEDVGVLAFSGIARPTSFASMLRSLGAVVKVELAYPDHYAYSKGDIADLLQRARNEKVNMIITTEKDAVRISDLKPNGIWALRIGLKIVENDAWEAVLLNKL